MPVIRRSVTIDRPISQVFRYVADFGQLQAWQPDVVNIHLSDDKIRIGSMVTIVREMRALFARLDINADVTDYQMNKRIELKGTIGVYPAIDAYTFESQARTTTVTETITVQMWFLPRWFTGWLYTLRLGQRADSTLKNLKKNLESMPA